MVKNEKRRLFVSALNLCSLMYSKTKDFFGQVIFKKSTSKELHADHSMKKTLLLALISLATMAASAQDLSLKGTLTDSISFVPASNINVTLKKGRDTLKWTTKTDINGNFTFTNLNRGFYFLIFEGSNYKSKRKPVRLMESREDKYYILPRVNLLKKVKVETTSDITLKGDTIQYTADSFKTQENASAEDLVKKLPGITSENGKINAQGEEVKRVLVDGKAYFGDDPKAALKNLPSEGVKEVQVYDAKTDKAKFTGFDDGESVKTINIITKPGMRNGLYGRAYAGYGTDEYYKAGISLSKTNSKGRLSIIGQSNNINSQNFSLDDVMGLLGSSGSKYKGRPTKSNGAPITRPGSQLYNFYVDNQNGITTTNALGLNYAGVINDKISVSGSYFISDLDNTNAQTTTQDFFGNLSRSQQYKEETNGNSKTQTHRVNGRLEFNLDTNNKLVYIPALSFQGIKGLSFITGNTFIADTLANKTGNNASANNTGLNFNNRLIYQHRFKTKGQTITLRTNANFRPSDGNTVLKAENIFFRNGLSDSSLIDQLTDDQQKGNTYNGDVSYTYLLNPKNQLEVQGGYGYNTSKSDRINYIVPTGGSEYNLVDTGLSSLWTNITQTVEAGLRIRKNVSKKLIYSYGLGIQQTLLDNEQTFPFNSNGKNTFYALVPKLFVRYKPSRFQRIFAFYRVRPNAPSISQLQNVVDNTNPLSLSQGNPNLNQQNTHFLVSRYSNIKPFEGKSFFAFMLLQASNNYMGSNTTIATEQTSINGVTVPKGGQYTQPINLSGYATSIARLSRGFKLKKLKSNLNTNLGFNGSRTPSLINGAKNINQNLGVNVSLNLTSNISKKLDFNIGAQVNQTFVSNNLQKDLNYNFTAPGGNAKVFWQFYKNWFLETDATYTSYLGLNDGFNTNVLLVNPALGFRTKKNLWEFKIFAFDLLNQNQAISRTVQQTYVEDVNSLVIQRYAMVQVLYNIKKFSKQGEPAYQPKKHRFGQ